ncbi:hypothetical protein [Kamptonema formosum]|nr:hypothetical protein [Oscillatoria sp. PCC 10802]
MIVFKKKSQTRQEQGQTSPEQGKSVEDSTLSLGREPVEMLKLIP